MPKTLLQAPEANFANVSKTKKKRIILSIDADVLVWFRERSSDYKTAINEALRIHCNGRNGDAA